MTTTATAAVQSTVLGALRASPLPVLAQDFSAIAEFCRRQKDQGVGEISAVLAEPGVLGELLSLVDVVAVNEAATAVCGAEFEDQVLGPFSPQLMAFVDPDSFVEQVVAVFDGRDRVSTEMTSGLDGVAVRRTVNWSADVADGVPDYSKILLIVEGPGNSDADGSFGLLGHSEQLQALIEIGGQLTSMLEPSVIFDKVLHTIEDALAPSQVSLVLLGHDEGAVIGTTSDATGATPDVDFIMSGLGGAAVRAGVALISDDISEERGFEEPALSAAAGMPGWSMIAAPIVHGGKAIGVIDLLFSPDWGKPPPEAAAYVATLAGQVAVAIRNAEVYAELAESHQALQSAHRQLQDTQTQLLSAQKMEAIGSLAAGIAHEINTPIQYVNDNVTFLSDAAVATGKLLDQVSGIMDRMEEKGETELVAEFREAVVEADWEFTVEEIPDAFEQTMEGVARVASIVRAMKEFAHPGTDDKAPVDLNRCIQTTVEVAKSEWKYVADVELQLDPDLPEVPALTGPFNQTILILIVNAAQALGEVADSFPDGKGQITITTATDGDHAVVSISDNGPGIPPSITDKIFDPFFTTKDVGKGSGQGLSIAHSVVVERHGGSIAVESEMGEGATFLLRLPLQP